MVFQLVMEVPFFVLGTTGRFNDDWCRLRRAAQSKTATVGSGVFSFNNFRFLETESFKIEPSDQTDQTSRNLEVTFNNLGAAA